MKHLSTGPIHSCLCTGRHSVFKETLSESESAKRVAINLPRTLSLSSWTWTELTQTGLPCSKASQKDEPLRQTVDSCAIWMFINCVQAIDKLTKHWQKTITQEAVLGKVACRWGDTRERTREDALYAKALKRDFSDGITELSVRKESTDEMICSNIINGLPRWPLWWRIRLPVLEM